MRVLILSDLHLDFWMDQRRDPFAGVEDEIASLDHLILAGDLTNKPKIRWPQAFRRLADLLLPGRIALFPGNHDFYDFRIDGEDRLAEIAAAHGVTYAQKSVLTLGPARLLCATLWTDFELGDGFDQNVGPIARRMNDFAKIRVASGGYRKLRPSDVVMRHRNHLAWLTQELSSPHPGPTFVATHHAPHPDVLAAYASDQSDLIEATQPDAWFFGHAHDARNLTCGATHLVNCSLGYPDGMDDPPHPRADPRIPATSPSATKTRN